MLKRAIVLIITLTMLLGLVGCGGEKSGTTEAVDYKIGVVTPTLSVSEDEFRGGQKVAEKYPGMIKHITLPENFSAEQETAISQITSLADDQDIKAIIICAGYFPLFRKLKNKDLK